MAGAYGTDNGVATEGGVYADVPDARLTELLRARTATVYPALRELRARHQPAVLAYARLCVEGVHEIHAGLNRNVNTVALVQGDALGGGFELALSCHSIVAESGVGALIRATYHLLGLRTYFTAGEKEVRAWTIHAGDTAPKAAGVIHSDFERGFIKAETVAYDDLIACGSIAAARDKGLYRMEGKDYVVADGDVMVFKFNV